MLVWGAGVAVEQLPADRGRLRQARPGVPPVPEPGRAQRRHPGQPAARPPDGRARSTSSTRRWAAELDDLLLGRGRGAACGRAAAVRVGPRSTAGRSPPSATCCAWRRFWTQVRARPAADGVLRRGRRADRGRPGAGQGGPRPAVAGAADRPIRWPWDTPRKMADVANRTAALLRAAAPPEPRRTSTLREDFIGAGYGDVTPDGREALRPAGPHRGHPARPGLHRQGDGRADRRRPTGPAWPGRHGGVHPHRRPARGVRLPRRPAAVPRAGLGGGAAKGREGGAVGPSAQELLRRLGSGEPIARACEAAGFPPEQFDDWWRQEARGRVPDPGGTRLAGVRQPAEIQRNARWASRTSTPPTTRTCSSASAMRWPRIGSSSSTTCAAAAAGRLAEILGPDGAELDLLARVPGFRSVLELDLLARTVGLRRIAEAEWATLPDETRTAARRLLRRRQRLDRGDAATGCRSSSTCSTIGPSRGRRSTA